MSTRACKGCKKEVEQERIELLDSDICCECAKKGIGQHTLKAATIYDNDGAMELDIMSEKNFETFDKAVKARDSMHSCS